MGRTLARQGVGRQMGGFRFADHWAAPVVGRIVICELLNSFPSIAFPNPFEMHSSIKYGVRPLLYALLRRQFFYPRGFAICTNTECRNFFNIERAGQQFCSPECSLRHRQRIYWEKRGKTKNEKNHPAQEDEEIIVKLSTSINC
jgi:hypothetical protein